MMGSYEHEFMSPNEFTDYIENTWSIETVVDFLENQLPNIAFTLDYENDKKETALEVLVKDGVENYSSRDKTVILLLLKHGADPMKKCATGCTIAERVLENEDSEFVMKFLDYVKDVNFIPALHIAVSQGRMDIIEYVLKRKVNINKRWVSFTTPLHMAAREDRVDITKFLLQNGADLEARDWYGETPLFVALNNNMSQQIRCLILENKANLDVKDRSGRTPLHALCSSYEEIDIDNCLLLLEKGCDPNQTEGRGFTPLHVLIDQVIHLRKYEPTKIVKIVELFIKHGADLNKMNKDRNTVLHLAGRLGEKHAPLLLLLLKEGADAFLVNNSGETFLDFYKNSERIRKTDECDVVVNEGTSTVWKRRQSPMETDVVVEYLIVHNFQSMLAADFKDTFTKSLMSDTRLNEIYNYCFGEFEAMTMTEIEKNVSYFTIFKSNVDQVAQFCRSETVRSKMSKFRQEYFRIFGNELKRRYEAGLKRFEDDVAGS